MNKNIMEIPLTRFSSRVKTVKIIRYKTTVSSERKNKSSNDGILTYIKGNEVQSIKVCGIKMSRKRSKEFYS